MIDVIVVGAGPAGLTASLLLAARGRQVLLIEAAGDVGGCHRSMYVGGRPHRFYYEHGPKVYSSEYTTMIKCIGLINKVLHPAPPVHFNDMFAKYRGGVGRAIADILRALSPAEYLAAAKILVSYDPAASVAASFAPLSARARDIIDRICSLSDGATSATTRMDKFLSATRFAETLYFPRAPLGGTLFARWKLALAALGCRILLNCPVGGAATAGTASTITTPAGTFAAAAVIFAVPPQSLNKIIPLFSPRYLREHSYISYFCATLHYLTPLTAPPNAAESQYGLVAVVLNDYMTLPTTAVQCAVGRVNVPGIRGKTAVECRDGELIAEIAAQLGLPRPDYAVIGSRPGEFPAYVDGLENVPIPQKIPGRGNMYTVGSHNTPGDFTTFESAARAAVSVVRSLIEKSPRD